MNNIVDIIDLYMSIKILYFFRPFKVILNNNMLILIKNFLQSIYSSDHNNIYIMFYSVRIFQNNILFYYISSFI